MNRFPYSVGEINLAPLGGVLTSGPHMAAHAPLVAHLVTHWCAAKTKRITKLTTEYLGNRIY